MRSGVSFLELGLIVETKVKPNSRRDTDNPSELLCGYGNFAAIENKGKPSVSGGDALQDVTPAH
jgi:hypothetical protein